jgi:hypothetical protein
MLVLLRKMVKEQYGKLINTPKDCERLAEIIFNDTGRKISATTLRRFFGLLQSKSKISAYNLDTLAIYNRFKDYNNFCFANDRYTGSNAQIIEPGINQLSKLTEHTINSIVKKSLTKFESTVPRERMNHRLNEFLSSPYIIFPLIAPGGYGKSIALTHWVKGLDRSENEFLFCNAAIFYQNIISQNGGLELQHYMEQRRFNSYTEHNKRETFGEKRFLLVIDALDEISPYLNKYKEFARFIKEAILRNGDNTWLKIILSVREITWSSLVREEFTSPEIINALYPSINIPGTGYSNIELLSNQEVKKILREHSRTLEVKIVYSSIPLILQDIIKTPVNLYYFIKLYTKVPNQKFVNNISLNRNFLKEFIFESKYSEFKEDIVWKMVALTDCNSIGFSISKNLLKKNLPIHLKRENGYHHAYIELLANGILYEERFEGSYGIYETNVGFRHQNFYYYLSALSQIKANKVLNDELFVQISQSGQSFEWKCNLIAILFEISYQEEDYKSIENFCSIDPAVLTSMSVRFAVGQSFRTKNSIRDRLIRKFASQEIGQIYFFEEFADTNYLYNNFKYRIEEYLKHKKTPEALLYGNSMLFLAGFLKMDTKACKSHYLLIKDIEPCSNIHPWPIARRLAYLTLYDFFIEGLLSGHLKTQIEENRKIAYQYEGYLDFGLVEFELPILVMLCLMKEYELIIEISEHAQKSYRFDNPKDEYFDTFSIYWNMLPYLFKEYAKYKLGIKVANGYIELLEQTINDFVSAFDDFQYKILLDFFLSDINASLGMLNDAKEYFDSAIELSQHAEYDFYIAWLNVNNPLKDHGMAKEGIKMFKKAGFALI